MDFRLPTKKLMNQLYSKIKSIYSNMFFEFAQFSLEQNIMYLTIDEQRVIVIVSPDDKLIHIFATDDEIFTCHHMLSGDTASIRSYGVNNIVIEQIGEGASCCGLEYYLDNYKHYTTPEGKTVFCTKFESGQTPSVLNREQVEFVIEVLDKLLLLQLYFEENEVTKEFDEEMFCICDFVGDEVINFEYDAIDNINLSIPLKVSEDTIKYVDDQVKEIEIQAGTLYLGQVIGPNVAETYETEKGIDVNLTPIYLYSLDEKFNYEHVIYTSKHEFKEEVLTKVLCAFLANIGLYDTIITDNIFIYNVLLISLDKLGIEVRLSENNLYCCTLNEIVGNISIELFSDSDSDGDLLELFKNNAERIIMDRISLLEDDMNDLEEEEEDFETTCEYVS